MFAASKSAQVTGSTPPPPTPTNDPQFPYVTALLTGDGTNGAQNNTFIDSSTNNFTVTRFGNTTQGSVSPYGGNWSNYFDGSGDYLTTPITASGPLALGSGSWTVEAWVMYTGASLTSGYRNFLTFCDNSGQPYLQFGTKTGTGYVFAEEGTQSTLSWTVAGTTLLTSNVWHHIATVRNGNNISVYLDGVLQGSITYSGTIQTFAKVQIASMTYNASVIQDWTGYISNVRIVKGTAVYTANFTPSTTPLTPITNTVLLTCQSPRFVDNSVNNFTVTKNGDTSVQVFSPFEPATLTPISYSGSFDGTGDYLSLATNAAFNITSGSTDSFICEFWVKFSSVAANTSLVDNGGLSGATLSNWNIQLNASQQFGIVWGNEGAQQGILASSTVPTTGQWYHIALVKTNADWALFINGARGISYNGINTASKSSATPLYIGYGITTSAGGNGLNGVVSNVRIYKGATASAPYLATSTTITVPTAPLTAITNTSLLTCQSNTFVDNSPNNFAITPFGDAKTTIQNPFGTTSALTTGYSASVASGAVTFDGNDNLQVASNVAFAIPADFTFECWFNSNTTGATSQIMEVATTGGLQIYYSGSQLYLSALGDAALLIYTYTIPLGVWTHIAYVRNGTGSNNLVLYINGVSVATATTNYSFNQAAFRIGGSSYYFNGSLSNVRLVKGTAVYTANFTPPTSPLTAVSGTSLLTCQSSTSITDASSNGFTITSVGTPVTTVANPFGITSVNGASMYFDGSGDWLTTASASTSFNLGAGDFTIECWVYPTGGELQYGKNVIGNTQDGTVNGWALSIQRSIGTHGIFLGLNNAIVISSGATTVTVNAWNHIAVVRSGSGSNNLKIYLNGVSVATATLSTNDTTNTAMSIGGDDSAAPYILTGYLSNVRYVKGTAVYTSNFVPPVAPVTAISRTSLLLNGTNGGIIDNAMMNDYETVGNAQVSTAVVKYGTGSMYFDGTGDYLNTYNPSYSLSVGSGDFTYECWLYVNALPGLVTSVYHLKNDTGLATTVFILELASNGAISISTGTALISSGTAGKIITGSWIHFAFVRTSGVFKTFFNGIQDISVANTTAYNGTYLFIGAWRYGSYDYSLNGYIDDLRITKGYARYVANFTPPTQAFPTY